MTEKLTKRAENFLRNIWQSIRGDALAFPPGHFYSPITSAEDVRRYWIDPDSAGSPKELPGLVLDQVAHEHLWRSWQPLLASPGPATDMEMRQRYRSADNRQYGPGDALVYSCMLRHLKPRRIIEIGSGYSSALALDTFDAFGMTWPDMTFIDPYPERLRGLLKSTDLPFVTIIERPIQQVGIEVFSTLDAGDILFVDSTHVAKTGSDVIHEIFNILPTLKSGVFVHFHDIFWPFEYPRSWAVERNYGWNEAYILRSFPMYNNAFRITFFADYMRRFGGDTVAAALARTGGDLGAGLWMQRVA